MMEMILLTVNYLELELGYTDTVLFSLILVPIKWYCLTMTVDAQLVFNHCQFQPPAELSSQVHLSDLIVQYINFSSHQ